MKTFAMTLIFGLISFAAIGQNTTEKTSMQDFSMFAEDYNFEFADVEVLKVMISQMVAARTQNTDKLTGTMSLVYSQLSANDRKKVDLIVTARTRVKSGLPSTSRVQDTM